MSYTTIIDLDEKVASQLIGTEYTLISDPDTSYRVSLNTLNEKLLELSAGTYADLTNKVIDSVTNFVHANAIHFTAIAIGDITKGTPVKLEPNTGPGLVYVRAATSNDDVIIGICEDGLADGVLGEIMVMGILDGIDVSSFSENDIVYYQNGAYTNNPSTISRSQMIGYVLDSNVAGKLLITNTNSNVIATNVNYDNTNSTLDATNVQSAIDELDARLPVLTQKIVITNNEIALPSKANGSIFNGIAYVYKTDGQPNVITEYTCTLSVDKTKVLFDSADLLNGYECTVMYISAI